MFSKLSIDDNTTEKFQAQASDFSYMLRDSCLWFAVLADLLLNTVVILSS